MSKLHQLNLQFRTKEPMGGEQAMKVLENLKSSAIGAALEAGVAIVVDDGPLNGSHHTHDAQSSNACPGCLRLAQDGRA